MQPLATTSFNILIATCVPVLSEYIGMVKTFNDVGESLQNPFVLFAFAGEMPGLRVFGADGRLYSR